MKVLSDSMRRLRRTRFRSLLFFLLITFAAALLATGGGLWKLCRENARYFESLFRTIATVEQKPERIVKEEVWDAGIGMYEAYNRREYGENIPLSVLDFEGAEYISGPERRAWYAAYVPEYKMLDDNEGMYNAMIVEASPVEDAVPSGPIRMEIKEILYSYYPENASHIYYCDHNNDKPEMMYADRTYIMCLASGIPHGWPLETDDSHDEYVPYMGPLSTQTSPDGIRMESSLSGSGVAEIVPGFYQSEEGKSWLAMIEELEMRLWSVPVTATNDTGLIQIFYDGDIYMEAGSDFAEEDYREGRKVCLVARKFARRNGLQVGDEIHLPLRYANYADSANTASEGELTASGEVYPVFEDGYWEICGIYDELPGGGTKSRGYRPAYNEVIIPAASIENSDADNIADFGPMKGYTTSFEIPNGGIEKWQELWEQQGVEGLEITFYDKGYSQLEDGLERMNKMALILLAAGCVSALSILIFFCHLFITKQSTRTAIERSLGVGKIQCAVSLLSDILLIAVAGCATGSVAGYLCIDKVMEQLTQVERFDRLYSSGMMGAAQSETAGYLVSGDWRVCAVTGAAMIALAVGTAAVMINKSLRREPLALLGGREE